MKLNEIDVAVNDRVRVIIEGTVKYVFSQDNVEIETDSGETLDLCNDEIADIEKVVRTFGPGDTVRHKVYRDHVYVVLPNGTYYSGMTGEVRTQPEAFTSEGYDLVASTGEPAGE